MSGTNHTTGGRGRFTAPESPARTRMLGFIFVVAAGALLILWLNRAIWRQVDHLREEYAAVQSESFYVGVALRDGVRSLNEKLMRYGLARDEAVRQRFLEEAAKLTEWSETTRKHLAELANLDLLRDVDVQRQIHLFAQTQAALNRYLQAAEAVRERTPPDSFEETYRQITAASQEALALCDELVQAQDEGFVGFLDSTHHTLTRHQQLLKLSLGLMLLLAVALAALIYRGTIAPLRRRLTESQAVIERQEKLASLGVLGAGVAHEIRNPLTAIKFRLFSLKQSLPPERAGDEDIGVITTEINRLDRIVKEFLQFARPSEPELARVPADRLFEEVRTLLQPELEKAGIVIQIAPAPPAWIRADPQQIKQVLINLVQNAAESIRRDGTITLRVRPDAAMLHGRSRSVVILSVTDTGQGIPPEVERRLFDPFFTTREGGTGLGLSIAARIVEKHGGLLRYRTELKRGTTFEIVLPAMEANETAPVDHRG